MQLPNWFLYQNINAGNTCYRNRIPFTAPNTFRRKWSLRNDLTIPSPMFIPIVPSLLSVPRPFRNRSNIKRLRANLQPTRISVRLHVWPTWGLMFDKGSCLHTTTPPHQVTTFTITTSKSSQSDWSIPYQTHTCWTNGQTYWPEKSKRKH